MDLRKLTSAAERVVYDAGRHVLQERTGTVLVSDEHEAAAELSAVSEVNDKLVRYLRAECVKLDPLNGFWEEVGYERRPGEYYWCAGGLDGAINYGRQMSEWTVTLSIFTVDDSFNPRPVSGVVHVPVFGLSFMGAEGEGGVRINRTDSGIRRYPMKPSIQKSVDSAVICFGMSYFSEESKQALEVVSRLAGHPADVKRVGPASLDICRVACGTYDAYFEPRLHSWDVPAMSAAIPIARAAGAHISTWEGRELNWHEINDVVATNGVIDGDLMPYLHGRNELF